MAKVVIRWGSSGIVQAYYLTRDEAFAIADKLCGVHFPGLEWNIDLWPIPEDTE